jgi:hypothetical protein
MNFKLFISIIIILILAGLILLISIPTVNELKNLKSNQKTVLYILGSLLIVCPSVLLYLYYDDTKQMKIYIDNNVAHKYSLDNIVVKKKYDDLKQNEFVQFYAKNK